MSVSPNKTPVANVRATNSPVVPGAPMANKYSSPAKAGFSSPAVRRLVFTTDPFSPDVGQRPICVVCDGLPIGVTCKDIDRLCDDADVHRPTHIEISASVAASHALLFFRHKTDAALCARELHGRIYRERLLTAQLRIKKTHWRIRLDNLPLGVTEFQVKVFLNTVVEEAMATDAPTVSLAENAFSKCTMAFLTFATEAAAQATVYGASGAQFEGRNVRACTLREESVADTLNTTEDSDEMDDTPAGGSQSLVCMEIDSLDDIPPLEPASLPSSISFPDDEEAERGLLQWSP